MRYKTILLLALALNLSFLPACFAGEYGVRLDTGPYNDPPAPRLRYPINETAVIAGDEPLEFRWWDTQNGIRAYTIKIYKGYNMYASGLIYKKELPSYASSLKVSQDLFEDGQVYTWSLLCVSLAGFRSERSFNSFKVIKEG